MPCTGHPADHWVCTRMHIHHFLPKQLCNHSPNATMSAHTINDKDAATTQLNNGQPFDQARQLTQSDTLRFEYSSGLPPCTGIWLPCSVFVQFQHPLDHTDSLVELLPTWEQPLLDYSTYLPATDLYVEHSDADGSECEHSDEDGSSGDDERHVWTLLGAGCLV